MNKEEAKQKLHNLAFAKLDTKPDDLKLADVMQIVNQIDEPQAGQAEQAPRYVKNILARLRELPLHDREVWLKAIMGEFEKDFSHAKWREGYEQGKFEGMVGREKVTVPQFVADWIEVCKEHLTTSLYTAMNPNFMKENNQSFDLILWIKKTSNQETFARAWLDGYEVEKEKRYLVKMEDIKTNFNFLNRNIVENCWIFSSKDEGITYQVYHTRKELEEAGFGWVFDCPGIEIEEVTE